MRDRKVSKYFPAYTRSFCRDGGRQKISTLIVVNVSGGEVCSGGKAGYRGQGMTEGPTFYRVGETAA